MLKPIWYCHNAGHSNNPCGLYVNCQEQRQQSRRIQQSSILSVDCDEQRHQKDVVLLTAESGNNSIQ